MSLLCRPEDYIAGAFKKTGLLPFTRLAHLHVNRADIQLGDSLVAAERMLERERKRESQLADRITHADIGASTTPLPMVIRELREISSMYGESGTKPSGSDAYGLRMWPQYDSTRNCRLVWRRCLQLSPALQARFAVTDPVELRKFFDVGLLMEEDMEHLTAPQALILGYVYV